MVNQETQVAELAVLPVKRVDRAFQAFQVTVVLQDAQDPWVFEAGLVLPESVGYQELLVEWVHLAKRVHKVFQAQDCLQASLVFRVFRGLVAPLDQKVNADPLGGAMDEGLLGIWVLLVIADILECKDSEVQKVQLDFQASRASVGDREKKANAVRGDRQVNPVDLDQRVQLADVDMLDALVDLAKLDYPVFTDKRVIWACQVCQDQKADVDVQESLGMGVQV